MFVAIISGMLDALRYVFYAVLRRDKQVMSIVQRENICEQFRRSPHHFYPSGNLYIEAGGVTFKVYKEILIRRSVIMSNILTNVEPNASGYPGTTEHNPLHVEDSTEEFTVFMNAIFGASNGGLEIDEYQEPPLPLLSDAVALLRAGTRWLVESMRSLAVYQISMLEKKGRVKPAFLMMISAEYQVPLWYHSAARALLTTPELELADSDVEVLDSETFQALLEWRQAIDRERIRLILAFPELPHNPACEHPVACADAAVVCMEGFEDFAHHPLSKLGSELAYRMEAAGLCAMCVGLWEGKIVESNAIKGEEDIIDVAVARIGCDCAGFVYDSSDSTLPV